ncbi:hypothetical protein Efla_000119 [Eimeria flavescens]
MRTGSREEEAAALARGTRVCCCSRAGGSSSKDDTKGGLLHACMQQACMECVARRPAEGDKRRVTAPLNPGRQQGGPLEGLKVEKSKEEGSAGPSPGKAAGSLGGASSGPLLLAAAAAAGAATAAAVATVALVGMLLTCSRRRLKSQKIACSSPAADSAEQEGGRQAAGCRRRTYPLGCSRTAACDAEFSGFLSKTPKRIRSPAGKERITLDYRVKMVQTLNSLARGMLRCTDSAEADQDVNALMKKFNSRILRFGCFPPLLLKF